MHLSASSKSGVPLIYLAKKVGWELGQYRFAIFMIFALFFYVKKGLSSLNKQKSFLSKQIFTNSVKFDKKKYKLKLQAAKKLLNHVNS